MTTTTALENSQLIESLHKLAEKNKKLVKSTAYDAPADPTIKVRSWKMNEFKYYDIPSPFPTLARGIFTVDVDAKTSGDNEIAEDTRVKHRIVARGYDKFFNIGEVPWTTWPSLEAHTAAPYTLSLKSNGCIIFIAALTPAKLLITSKHSVGAVVGSTISHAEAGEQWLRKYLAQKGKTEEQLAGTLWEHNWTAIAELCDDSFEEHVLGYPPEKTGLHLHGINESTKHFKTLAQKDVDAFADEWGFIKTPSIVINSIAEVKEFTAEVAKTGAWNGEAVEGFVVRTHVTEPPTEGKRGTKAPSASPYAPGSSFFFKVKFDEPYMMYRDWREVTKTLLSEKDGPSEARVPKSKLKRPETRVYVRWIIREIKRDRTQFAEFNKGRGIIATRERFLTWLSTDEGQVALKAAKGNMDVPTKTTGAGDKNFGKTIIVPVAIPGCGKTVISVALAHIFGFGHTQSDDVHVKKAAPVFIRNVVGLLSNCDVVIADKNNHLRQHRQALRDATAKMSPPVRLLALYWPLDKPYSTIHRICGDRVLQRGDNHQTLRADKESKTHEDVIWMFITGTEELAGSEIDATIEMDLEATLEQNLDTAVEGLVKELGLSRPSKTEIAEALDIARGYAPAVKKPDEPRKKKAEAPRYFGLLAEIDLDAMVSPGVARAPQKSQQFWKQLKEKGQVGRRPHVTIVHSKSLPGEVELWERCMQLHKLPTPPLFKFKVKNIVWNDRVMAATVDDLELDTEDAADVGQEGHEFMSKLAQEIRESLHITVGTRDKTVPPVEAKALVEEWRKGKSTNIYSINLDGVVVRGRIKGMTN